MEEMRRKKTIFYFLLVGIFIFLLVGGYFYFFIHDADTSLVTKDGSVREVDDTKVLYTNDVYDFSFLYPKGFTVGEFQEGEGTIVLFQNKSTDSSFQVYIAPFDEADSITPERISLDLPDLKIINPQQVLIANDALQALIFETNGETFGRTREIWFVAHGQLFQITTSIDNDDVVGPVLKSLTFEDRS